MAKQTKVAKKPVAKTTKSTTARPAKKASAEPGQTVDGYVATLEGWRKQCISILRQLIREAAPKAVESIKWAQPVYEHHGPFAWIKAHTNHVSCGFWRGAELPDPNKLLEGTGSKMRHVKIASLNDIRKKELQEFVRRAVKLNETLGNPTQSAMHTKK